MNSNLSPTQLLSILDPDKTGSIDLEQLRPLIAKLPEDLQSPIGSILRSYVFENHSFQLPNEHFLRLLNGPFERKNSFNSVYSPTKSVTDSFLRSESSMWLSKSNTIRSVSSKRRLRSFSPKKRNSYKELYQRKKSVECETWKRSTKLFDRIESKLQTYSVFSEKSQSFAIEKPLNRDYRFKYSNFNELVKIRQKHLELCNKYKN